MNSAQSKPSARLTAVSESLVDSIIENRGLKKKLGARGRQLTEMTSTVAELRTINRGLANNGSDRLEPEALDSSKNLNQAALASGLQHIQTLLGQTPEVNEHPHTSHIPDHDGHYERKEVGPVPLQGAAGQPRTRSPEVQKVLERDVIYSFYSMGELVAPEVCWIVGGTFRSQLQQILVEVLGVVELREFTRRQMICRGNKDKSSPLRRRYADKLVEVFHMTERGERRLWQVLKETTLLGICIRANQDEGMINNYRTIADQPGTPTDAAEERTSRQDTKLILAEADVASIRLVIEDRISMMIDVKAACRTAFTFDSRDNSPIEGNKPVARITVEDQEDWVSLFRVSEVGLTEDETWARWTADVNGLLGLEESSTNHRGKEI